MMYSDTVIIIPARLDSVRLPQKVLAQIGAKKLIEWVVHSAKSATIADVVLAYSDQKILDDTNLDITCIKTDPTLPNGTVRVYEAFRQLKKKYKYVINLQGDLPFCDPSILKSVADALHEDESHDIVTPVCEIELKDEVHNPNIVKVAMSANGRGIYFSRSPIPHGSETFYKHIGIYGFKAEVLERFIGLPESPLERAEKLEQLRALEVGINISCVHVNSFPQSVDIAEDLEKVRKLA